MTTSDQMDTQYTDGDIARRLKDLEDKVQAYEQGGFDLFRQFGYLQLGLNLPRLDKSGMQIRATGVSRTGFWIVRDFFPGAVPIANADGNINYASIEGLMEALYAQMTVGVEAKDGAVEGYSQTIYLGYNDGTTESSVRHAVGTAAGETGSAALVFVPGSDVARFILGLGSGVSETILTLRELTTTNATPQDGDIWHYTDLFFGRLNGVTKAFLMEGDALASSYLLGSYKDADQENTTTTLATDSELSVSLAASAKYQFEAKLFFLNDGAAEGYKVAVTGTAGIQDLKAQIVIFDDTLNTIVGFARVTAINTAVGAGLSIGSNFARVEGSIETTTAGTFAISFAQNAAGAAAGVHHEIGCSWTVLRTE